MIKLFLENQFDQLAEYKRRKNYDREKQVK